MAASLSAFGLTRAAYPRPCAKADSPEGQPYRRKPWRAGLVSGIEVEADSDVLEGTAGVSSSADRLGGAFGEDGIRRRYDRIYTAMGIDDVSRRTTPPM